MTPKKIVHSLRNIKYFYLLQFSFTRGREGENPYTLLTRTKEQKRANRPMDMEVTDRAY